MQTVFVDVLELAAKLNRQISHFWPQRSSTGGAVWSALFKLTRVFLLFWVCECVLVFMALWGHKPVQTLQGLNFSEAHTKAKKLRAKLVFSIKFYRSHLWVYNIWAAGDFCDLISCLWRLCFAKCARDGGLVSWIYVDCRTPKGFVWISWRYRSREVKQKNYNNSSQNRRSITVSEWLFTSVVTL